MHFHCQFPSPYPARRISLRRHQFNSYACLGQVFRLTISRASKAGGGCGVYRAGQLVPACVWLVASAPTPRLQRSRWPPRQLRKAARELPSPAGRTTRAVRIAHIGCHASDAGAIITPKSALRLARSVCPISANTLPLLWQHSALPVRAGYRKRSKASDR
jgi:hypothetical protein